METTRNTETDREFIARVYGATAVELIDDGWTIDAALNHVQGVCDHAICIHRDHGCDVD